VEIPIPSRKKANGRCSVCTHVERLRIELLVATGAHQRAVAKKFGLSKDALSRHWLSHVDDERRVALQFGPVERERLASLVAEESTSVIDHFRAVRSALYTFLNAALTAGDVTGGSMASGRLLECLNSMARITGEISQSPMMQLTQNNFFLNDPQFAQFQAQLVAALRPFPEARKAVIAVFEQAEHASMAPPTGITYEQKTVAA